MKILLLISVLLLTTFCYSQKKKKAFAEYNTTNLKITSLIFSVDYAAELKTIKWSDIKEIFSKNENSKQEIELVFKFDLPASKNKISGEFKIHGENKNLDNIISRAKKGVKGMITIINNNN